MIIGALVREECSLPSKARVGTVVKVTPLILSYDGLQQAEADIENAKANCARHGRDYDPTRNYVIRPGKVFSVRWQDDPTRVTVHVAYDDCNGAVTINLGCNPVELVK